MDREKQANRYKILEIIALIFTPIFLFVQTFINNKLTLLPTLIVIIATVFIFMIGFEKRKVSVVEMTCVVVLSVVAALLRTISIPIPHAIFTTAVIIISAISFGESSGFMTGVLGGLLSSLLQGIGPWTPWQIYAWGIIGYVAGLLSKTKLFNSNIAIIFYGFISGFLYGIILNIYFVLSVSFDSTEKIIQYFAASVMFELSHAVSTAVFLAFTIYPWKSLLKRIQLKFDN